MILYTMSVSRETLTKNEADSANIGKCLILFCLIIADIVSANLIAGLFYFLQKNTKIDFHTTGDEDSPITANELKKFFIILVQQIFFTIIMLNNIPSVKLTFSFAWLLLGITICIICLHGFSVLLIRKTEVFPPKLLEILNLSTYTQYTLAILMIFYKNYKNYNTYTRYESELESYQQAMRDYMKIWTKQTSVSQKDNLDQEMKLKKQINEYLYNLDNLPLNTNDLASSVLEKQDEIENVLKDSQSLLSTLQNRNNELTNNQNIAIEKMILYESNPLFYSDYLDYINKIDMKNCLDKINYFKSSFSVSEIVKLINLQNTYFTNLLSQFLQVQNMMRSITSYSPQKNTDALFDYLKYQNPIFLYSNKLSLNIDGNILFCANNETYSNSIIIRDTLPNFLSCNFFTIKKQDGINYDYIVKSGKNYGIAFSIDDLYFMCLQINDLNYSIVFQGNVTHLVCSQVGWILNFRDSKVADPKYFKLLNVVESIISTSSPVSSTDNRAFYNLTEDASFSQGMSIIQEFVSSFSNFDTTLGNITWNFNQGPNFTIQDHGINISFNNQKLQIDNKNLPSTSASSSVSMSLSQGNFEINIGDKKYSGTVEPLVF